MQFFLDTANLDAIQKYAAWGVIDGVTTNPSLIAKEGAVFEKRIREIAAVIQGSVSAEVLASDTLGMVRQGREYAQWSPNICVKIPMTVEGLQAVRILKSEGIQTNVTLVFSTSQALLAAKAGATYVSPFIGRLDDISEDGLMVVQEMADIFANYEFDTRILVASIRHPRHVVEAARIGADIATMPPEVLEKMVHHPLTDKGLQTFLADFEKTKFLFSP